MVTAMAMATTCLVPMETATEETLAAVVDVREEIRAVEVVVVAGAEEEAAIDWCFDW